MPEKTGPLTRRLFALFSEILDYPNPKTAEQAQECALLLAKTGRDAQEKMSGFAGYSSRAPLGSLEEIYTSTFDIQPVCCPYAGHHLFGEGFKRSTFMVKLTGMFREMDFSPPQGELPDHITVLLRFLAGHSGSEQGFELARHCLLPSIKKMHKSLKNSFNPYKDALESLERMLEQIKGPEKKQKKPPRTEKTVGGLA